MGSTPISVWNAAMASDSRHTAAGSVSGPLPPALQKYTVYVAVPMKNEALVRPLIAHLTAPAAREQLARAGYTSPEAAR